MRKVAPVILLVVFMLFTACSIDIEHSLQAPKKLAECPEGYTPGDEPLARKQPDYSVRIDTGSLVGVSKGGKTNKSRHHRHICTRIVDGKAFVLKRLTIP